MAAKLSLFDILNQAQQSGSDVAEIYKKAMRKKSDNLRVPVGVQLELLPVCNFNCKFCYVRMSNEEVKKSGHHIMRFNEWKRYIDECVKFGTNRLIFSGGECTLHPDFIELYEYAYNCGFEMGLITNGSCITEEIFELFEKYPPSEIHITLYGMSSEVYERNCGNGAAFEKVIKNINRLKDRGFNLFLNYTVGKENICDLEAACEYAKEKKIFLKSTNTLFNMGKCDSETIEAELAGQKEFNNITHKYYSSLKNVSFDEFEESYFTSFMIPLSGLPAKGLRCSAGRSGFDVNWLGEIRPCTSIDYKLDPKKIGFNECWEKINEWVDNVPILEECDDCIFQNKCMLCPALHYGDMGEFGKVSPRFCFKKLYPEEAAASLAKYEEMKANGEIE
ncbi:MAG: radical SAM protein [Eubacterium sp.]|nr:radical SAM protein [Eubacterium sp.]